MSPNSKSIVDHVHRALDEFRASRLQPVINGTGIVIHTNFGRAPLAREAMRALSEIGAGVFESRIRSRDRANAAGAALMSRVRWPCFVKPKRQRW